MKYTTTTPVPEAQLNELIKIIVSEDAMISLDKDDILSVIEGKEGVMYEIIQEADENHGKFMQNFFNELARKPEIKGCQSLLLCINVPDDDSFMMDDMSNIHEFMEKLPPEAEVKWGMNSAKGNDRMKIIVIAA